METHNMEDDHADVSEPLPTHDLDSQFPPTSGTMPSYLQTTPTSTSSIWSTHYTPSMSYYSAPPVHDTAHRRPLLNDNIYAPPTFHGKSTEDAAEYLAYVERFAAYKHMTQTEMLELMPVLCRSVASDFYESMAPETRATWQAFKKSFLERFGRSEATRWRDASDLLKQVQGPAESCEDYIARVTKLAKRVPGLDEAMLRYAVISGLKNPIKTHVLQADVKSMQELLQASRIAEMANSASNDSMTTLLDEIRTSNQKHAEHAAAFQQLTARLDKLSITSVDDQNSDMPRGRSPSPRRVRFEDTHSRRPSPAPRPRSPYFRPSSNFRPSTTYRRQPSAATSTCQRCGSAHANRFCPAQNATCLYCHKPGHFRAVCRQARRGRDRPRI